MSLDKLKSRKRKESVETPRLSDSDMEDIIGKEDYRFTNRELTEIITELTKKLSHKQKLVFTLRDLEGLDIEEVSGTLNMSAGSVKSNLIYARRKIKEHLTKIYKWK